MLAEIRCRLIDLAKRRETITYGELARQLETVEIHPYSYAFAGLLKAVCQMEDEAGRGLLCALVVRQSDGLPGNGFFRYALQRGRQFEDEQAFWEQEVNFIYQVWRERDK